MPTSLEGLNPKIQHGLYQIHLIEFRLNDEIRFENSEEKFAFKIIKVLSPKQNFIINGRNKLQLTVASITGPNTGIDPSTNLDFFLIRRYIESLTNSVLDR